MVPFSAPVPYLWIWLCMMAEAIEQFAACERQIDPLPSCEQDIALMLELVHS